MEDSAYNRHIAEQVNAINKRYIKDAEQKGYMLESMPIATNTVVRGGGFWDDFGHGFVQGFTAPLKLLGGASTGGVATGGIETGGKRRRGRPSKKAGIATGGVATGGSFLDAFPFQVIKDLAGGNQTGGKRRRGRPSKKAGIATGSGFLDDLVGTAAHLAPLIALGKPKRGGSIGLDNRDETFATPAASGRLRGRSRKGAGFFDDVLSGVSGALNIAHKGLSVADKFGLLGKGKQAGASTGGKGKQAGASTGGMQRKLLNARAVGSGYSELEGAGFFDDVLSGVSGALDIAHKGLSVADKFGLMGRKGRGRKGGVSTGGARGASKWINFVKQWAAEHNMKYNEALKDPRCKNSYKKSN